MGRTKNPAVLFFQDSYCMKNDSITNWFLKNNYQVIIAERLNTDPLFVLNTDHPLIRELDGLALTTDLKSYPIEYIAASGLEVHATVNWFVNTDVKGGFLFPFYKGSFKEYLVESIYKDKQVLPGYPPNSTMTAPKAMSAINKIRLGPTVSFKNTHPIKAAKIVDVSRNIAASPTLSRRVANIIDPKLKNATQAPIMPRKNKGNRSGRLRILRHLR